MADEDLYGVLGVSRNASESEIRRTYHRLAKQYHPDKNPGPDGEEKFKKIQSAYEILSDAQKREMYDNFGMDGVRDGGGGGFSSFFGGGGESLFSSIFSEGLFGGGASRRRRKGDSIGIPLEVTLEELYSGATKFVEYKRKVLCKTCGGSGSKTNSGSNCRKCRGSGISVTTRQIGPGMLQQMQGVCSDCNGSGTFIKEKDRCKKCKGRQTVEIQHKLEVPVSAGMEHNQKIPFRQMADESPDMEAGDIVVILQELDHPTFERKDSLDLYMTKKITLSEALCGFTFVVEHLDGRQLAVSSGPRQVIFPGCERGLTEEGMPKFRHPEIKGNLYFRFEIIFPENNFLDEDKLKQLEALLPPKPRLMQYSESEVEEVTMMDFDITRGSEDSGRSREAYEEGSDDDGDGPSRVGCAHQ